MSPCTVQEYGGSKGISPDYNLTGISSEAFKRVDFIESKEVSANSVLSARFSCEPENDHISGFNFTVRPAIHY